MTTMTMTTNTAGGIVVVLPPLLSFFRVNDVSQVQANQECQQHMSTTTTMTSVANAATTPPISPTTVIQPVLPLAPNNGQNDILPSNINMPTSSHLHNELQIWDGRINALESMSSHLHHELQIRDGKINALESAVEQLRTQLIIFWEQMRAQQMSAVNRRTTPTDIELAFQDGCTGSPNDDAGTWTMSLNTTLETNMNDLIMKESNRARVNDSQRLDQCNNVARRDPARREEEQEADTPQRRIAREQPERRDEENEQRCTRREQPGVLEHEAIQCVTA
jgi:hypothetical protein